MSDEEALAALTVIARRLGLVPDGKRLALVDDEVAVAPMCLAYGTNGGLRLCCTYDQGHTEPTHSWQRAAVGSAACGQVATDMGAVFNGTPCQRVSHHDGEHRAVTPWGQRIVFGAADPGADPTNPRA